MNTTPITVSADFQTVAATTMENAAALMPWAFKIINNGNGLYTGFDTPSDYHRWKGSDRARNVTVTATFNGARVKQICVVQPEPFNISAAAVRLANRVEPDFVEILEALENAYRAGLKDGQGQREAADMMALAALPVIEPQTSITLIEEDGVLCIANADLCPGLSGYENGETRALGYWFSERGTEFPSAGTLCDYPGHDVETCVKALRQNRDAGRLAATVTTAVLPNGDVINF